MCPVCGREQGPEACVPSVVEHIALEQGSEACVLSVVKTSEQGPEACVLLVVPRDFGAGS